MKILLKSRHISMMAVFCLIATGCHSSDKEEKQPKVAMADESESQKDLNAYDAADESGSQSQDVKASAADESGSQSQKSLKAYAIINPVEGAEAVGVVSFMEVEDGVRIIADVAGLKPGLHGFHVHEHGDCGGPGAEHAGGHYDPTHHPHGGPDSPIDQRHVGDLGNLDANDEGIAHYNRVDKVISLKGEYSIIGKTVIVHADPDDLKTQPTGNSGKRIACGVITEGQK